MDANAVVGRGRLLGVVDRDVDVHRERRLAAGELAHRLLDLAVSRVGRHPRPIPRRKRVRARRRHGAVLRGERDREPGAHLGELGDGLAGGCTGLVWYSIAEP